MNDELTAKLEETLSQITTREKEYAGWMAQIITSLPSDPSYRKLNSRLREEIEAVMAAVE